MKSAETLHSSLDSKQCERARLSRDSRFDGLFFTAVLSTLIYCRPVCPAPAPKPKNVVYFGNAAAAELAGFRPCLRCRPELSPGNDALGRGDQLIERALALIDSGVLEAQSLPQVADRLGIGVRQLRRLFVDRLGASPLQVWSTGRLLLAKKLLSETRLAVTDIALASGFRSVRRFNDAYLTAYRMPPSALRQRPNGSKPEKLILRLAYRPPYDFVSLLDFLRARALPGLERVDQTSYSRIIGSSTSPAWIRIAAASDSRGAKQGHELTLELTGVAPADLQSGISRVRRMFDLDANPAAIGSALANDSILGPLVQARPGLRIPGAWDEFEVAVRAVLGQQVSVAAAKTMANRLLTSYGERIEAPGFPDLCCFFPSPAKLAGADLREIGLTRAKTSTIQAIARAAIEGELPSGSHLPLSDYVEQWTRLPGVGPWTAHYLGLRARSHPDAFPASDLILRRQAGGSAPPLTTNQLQSRAESWRPWRAYAAIHLWRSSAD